MKPPDFVLIENNFSTAWIDPITVGEDGIVVGRSGAFGLGTLLVLRCAATDRVLMGRKSFRQGFEGSNQFAFPGGMLRSDGVFNFDQCLEQTLVGRVSAETGISVHSIDRIRPLDTIKGKRLVSTAILPFYADFEIELPIMANDPTVYAVGWYDPIEVMHEVTQTNALILAQALWTRFTPSQQEKIKPILRPHFEVVKENAELLRAREPKPAWEV